MAYVAMPESTTKDSPAPAIIMIQEIFGVNQEMRDKCEDMARQGYVAICPDLFWRIEPGIQLLDSVEEELQRAFDLFGEFNVRKGMDDLNSVLGYARHMDEVKSRKVGCMGFCLGGKLAYMMAVETDIDASVSYYGVAIETMLEYKAQIDHPLLMHIAEEDEFVNKEAQAEIRAALEDHPFVTMYSYEGADHAFARTGGMHYKDDAAKAANERTKAFLMENLK